MWANAAKLRGVTWGRATALLTSPAFIGAIALLLLNDWVLKSAIGGWWTGKISDFAGLFAFAVFWSALFPSRRSTVFAITAIGFLLWKSPASTPALAAWNGIAPWSIERVIDYTDWMALLALIPAYGLTRGVHSHPETRLRRLGAVAVATMSIFAFAATSVRRPNPISGAPVYTLPGSAAAVRGALDSLGFDPYYVRRGDTTDRTDTLTVHVRQPPERWVRIAVELREVGPESAMLRVVEIMGSPNGPAPSTDGLFRAFSAQVIEPLRAWLTSRRPANNSPPPQRFDPGERS